MTRIIMHGCNGHMGRVISDLVEKDEKATIVAGVDVFNNKANSYTVYKTMKDCNVDADVIIDFSNASAVDGMIEAAVEKKLPVVLCTTGLSDEQLAKVNEASKQIPILRSANMSIGINALMKILNLVTKLLADEGYDIEIIEKHHNLKLDAPSGTALALADCINDAADNRYEYIYDRHDRRQKRDKKELGISAMRGGTIVGEHEIFYAGTDEVIEIKHTAYSKAVFAKGSIAAAHFLKDQKPGMYDMSDVLDLD